MTAFDEFRAAVCRVLDDDGNTSGSGFAILPDGLILTCHHVIYGLRDLRVRFGVGGSPEGIPATYDEEHSDPVGDIAVIRINSPIEAAVQLGRIRNGAQVRVYGFRPNLEDVEPEGHAFRGTVAEGQRVRLLADKQRHALAELNQAAPWNVLTEERDAVVHNLVGGPGFTLGNSGSPVYDPELRRVVGLLRAVEKDGEQAYVLAIDQLFAKWPEVSRLNAEAVPDEPLDQLARDWGLTLVAEGARPRPSRQSRAHFDEILGAHGWVGGRAHELARLDEIVARGGGYELVTSPSGFGKTALLATWVRRLTDQRIANALVFITSQLDASAEFCLSMLCQQLLTFHQLGGDLPRFSLELRRLTADLLRLASSTGEPLVVLIDGLDELTGLKLGPGLFPGDLPHGTSVVLSARDVSKVDWERRLGIRLEVDARIELEPLDEAGVGEVVRIAAIPGLDEQLVPLLLDKSQGDPFYVHDLLDLVRTRKPSDVATALGMAPAGHGEYLKRWWSDGIRQCGVEPFADLLGVLAVAKAALTAEELASVSDADKLNNAGMADLLENATRYVAGNEFVGYEISHTRIRLFVEGLLKDTMPTYRRRLAAYCSRWQDGTTSPHARDYALTYGMEHFLEAGMLVDAFELLDPSWIAAKWSRDGSYAGVIEDLGVLASAASEPEADLAIVAACCIARSTAREAMSEFPGALLRARVFLGEIDVARGVLRSVTESRGKPAELCCAVAEALVASRARYTEDPTPEIEGLLARALSSVLRLRTGADQLEIVQRVAALMTVDSGLDVDARARLLAKARTTAERLSDPVLRAAALGRVAGALFALDHESAPDVLAQATGALGEIPHPPDRAFALAATLSAHAQSGSGIAETLVGEAVRDETNLVGSVSYGYDAPAAVLIREGIAAGLPNVADQIIQRVADARANGIAIPTSVESALADRAGTPFPTEKHHDAAERIDELRRESVATRVGDGTDWSRTKTQVDAILAEVPANDPYPRVSALAAAAELAVPFDPAAAASYADAATALQLVQQPEGDLDALYAMLVAALHDARSFDEALETIGLILWDEVAARLLAMLALDPVLANPSIRLRYISALRDMVLRNSGESVFGLGRTAAQLAWDVSTLEPEAAEALCDAIIEATGRTDPRMSLDSLTLEAAARARVRPDDFSHFDALLEAIADGPPFDFGVNGFEFVFERLALLADAAPAETRDRLDRAHALLEGFGKDEDLALRSSYAAALASLDIPAARKILDDLTLEIEARDQDQLIILSFAKLVADLAGRVAGPQYRLVAMAANLAEAAVKLGNHDAGSGHEVFDAIAKRVAEIESPSDRAQALGDLAECTIQGSVAFLDASAATLSRIVANAGDLTDDNLQARALSRCARAYARSGLMEQARLATNLIRDPDYRDRTESAVERLGFRPEPETMFERAALEGRGEELATAMFLHLQEGGDPVEAANDFKRFLVDNDHLERHELLVEWLRAMLIPALSLGGIDQIKRIISAVKDVDSRFAAAASEISTRGARAHASE
jgi:hypothetical protein